MTQSTSIRPSAAATPRSKRLDIQGLRAVAVLAVIANHVFGFPGGGFVGVDVFFVISGFVITSVLLREHGRHGRINFVNFYKRRVRRIMPASTVTLAVTVAAAYLTYLAGRANSVLTDGLWALLFAGNWRFASNGTDYWAKDTPVSPLQHYWSLGVEEQFYFVWPAIVAAVLLFAGVKHARGRALLALSLTALSAGSFAWAVHETATNPAWAYFSTFSRAWELGVGALIAVAAGAFSRIPSAVRPVLAALGLAGIIASLAVITKESAFPAPWAALPVLATAMVIVAGTGTGSGTGRQGPRLLTNRTMTYMGDVSYSLYLWHFPAVILCGALLPGSGPAYYLSALAATAVLSLLSYYFVEQPVLKSAWLSTSPAPRRRFDLARASKRQLTALGLCVAAVVTILSLGVTALVSAGGGAPAAASPSLAASLDGAPGTNQDRLTAELNAALARTDWPELKPSLDVILSDTRPEEDGYGCGKTDLAKPDCSFDSGKSRTVVVMGDSTAITLLPTVRAALGDTYNVRGMTMAGCAALDIHVKADKPQFAEDCAKFQAQSIQTVNAIKPAMVFMSSTSGVLGQLVSGAPEEQAGAEWRQGTANELKSLAPSGAKLFVVAGPPMGKPPVDCATRTSTPQDCEYTVPPSFTITARAMKDATDAAGATFIDTRSWFCSGNTCPAFIRDTPLKRDAVHTTRQYAVLLAGVFKDAVTAAK
ncbi:acyltransferase family protein [Arthrobacter sp. 92]|uniref:acyltransferase family protein n=1 Tax=Arthrobacter sp. 92 TaxID=3418175 RepID=UPI003D04D8DA